MFVGVVRMLCMCVGRERRQKKKKTCWYIIENSVLLKYVMCACGRRHALCVRDLKGKN